MTQTADTQADPSPPARLRAAWTVAVINQKGGVGKTALALGLASVTAAMSGRALVVDVDSQGSANEIAEAAGDGLPFDFAPGRDPRELAGLRNARDYDTVYVDTPGNLDDTPVLAGVLASADAALIPFVPERAAITPTLRTARVAAAAGVPHAVVLSMVDPLRGPGPEESARELMASHDIPVLHSAIRRYVAHAQSQVDGLMITQYRGDRSWRPARADMEKVHGELLLMLGGLARDEAR
jgi:chromosome partitioning protein